MPDRFARAISPMEIACLLLRPSLDPFGPMGFLLIPCPGGMRRGGGVSKKTFSASGSAAAFYLPSLSNFFWNAPSL